MICFDCGKKYGKSRIEGATTSMSAKCDWCGETTRCVQSYKFGLEKPKKRTNNINQKIAEYSLVQSLLERVSPDSQKGCNEINRRFWCVKNDIICGAESAPDFVHDRNALRDARPAYVVNHGYIIEIKKYIKGWVATLGKAKSLELPTEEFAELHAICGAYIWELENE